MTDSLNADYSRRAVMDTGALDWRPSPSPTVWRKRLDLAAGGAAGEVSRVTSIVRYDPDSRFPPHDHPDGEEILVLEGTFSDEHGDYPAGTYLLNPPGFRHAPYSRDGCVLFVKLRQFAGEGREHVVVDTRTAPWRPGRRPGHEVLPLYEHPDFPERVSLGRFAPGLALPRHEHPGGEEVFVLDGVLEDEDGRYPASTWLRTPPGSGHAPRSATGCTFYLKTGHLAG